MRNLLLTLSALAGTLASGCTAPYFANAARDFGTAITSPATDMGPYFRGISSLCRRQADLAYLRSRFEDPLDKKPSSWARRSDEIVGARKMSIEASCARTEHEIAFYNEIYSALRAYGLALRSLGDSESTDFRESFRQISTSLGRLSVQVDPGDPGVGQAVRESYDAANRLLRMAINARTEHDLKVAIRDAAVPARKLLERLEYINSVYASQVQFHTQTTLSLLAQVEAATLPHRPGTTLRHVDVLTFYDLAQRTGEELERLAQSSRASRATVTSLRQAHERLVEAANNRIPAKEAFRLVRQSFVDLALSLQNVADPLEGVNP